MVLLVGLGVQVSAWAWNGHGHRLLARLAETELTPKTQAAIQALLALEPGATLESVSTWADEHRNPTTASWHYVNFPRGDCHYVAERDCPGGKCIVSALTRQIDVLASDAPPEKRLLALKYVVHLAYLFTPLKIRQEARRPESGGVMKVDVLGHKAGRADATDPALDSGVDELIGHPRLHLASLYR